MKKLQTAVFILLVAWISPMLAQTNCPVLPGEQHVAATDPALVPAGFDDWLLTHDGAWFRGRPNHLVAYVQTGPNEQQVWFFVNSVPHYTRIYYNRRFRADATAPWMWAYYASPKVLELPGPGSVSVNTVLYSPTPKYGPSNGGLYKYAMFLVSQPSACDGITAGYGMVSFSNTGTCWTTPLLLQRSGGPSSTCAPYGHNLVPVEALDAIDAGDRIYFIGIEGNVQMLIDPANMDSTLTAWGYALPASIKNITLGESPFLTTNGVFSPEGVSTTNHRFKTYSYFINLAMAWDAARGDLYVTRGYPYPFDRSDDGGATVPSRSYQTDVRLYNDFVGGLQHVEGCVGSPATYPNRIQIYKMHLGSLSNFSEVSTGTWTLVADYGNQTGYTYGAFWNTVPIMTPQQSVGRDYGAASFLRDGVGNMQFMDGSAYVFGGPQYLMPLSAGQCYATGNERLYSIAIPGLTP